MAESILQWAKKYIEMSLKDYLENRINVSILKYYHPLRMLLIGQFARKYLKYAAVPKLHFFPILAHCVIFKNIACLNMNPNIEKTNGKPCTYDTQPIYPNT